MIWETWVDHTNPGYEAGFDAIGYQVWCIILSEADGRAPVHIELHMKQQPGIKRVRRDNWSRQCES